MLDLITKEWTNKNGETTSLVRLENHHLLNIQQFLRRLVKNKDNYIARRQAYWETVACQFDDFSVIKTGIAQGVRLET